MKHRCILSLLALAVLAASIDAGAQGGTRPVTLSVAVDPRKPTGDAWDAFGGAPDIALCVNSALGQQCFSGTTVQPTPAFVRGACQDSFSCRFVVYVPTVGPFSVALYDVDLSQHDTIGACMISGRGQRRCGAATVTSF
jgi:hypothetical protein